jgi:hypothetical protein
VETSFTRIVYHHALNSIPFPGSIPLSKNFQKQQRSFLKVSATFCRHLLSQVRSFSRPLVIFYFQPLHDFTSPLYSSCGPNNCNAVLNVALRTRSVWFRNPVCATDADCASESCAPQITVIGFDSCQNTFQLISGGALGVLHHQLLYVLPVDSSYLRLRRNQSLFQLPSQHRLCQFSTSSCASSAPVVIPAATPPWQTTLIGLSQLQQGSISTWKITKDSAVTGKSTPVIRRRNWSSSFHKIHQRNFTCHLR